MCMNALPVSMSVSQYVPGTHGGWEKGSNPLGLESYMIVSCHVGGGY